MVSRAVISIVDDSKKMQTLQIQALAGETLGDVERIQNFGFSSVPKNGAEALVVFVSGNRDHGVVVAVDDRLYRVKDLGEGQSVMYDAAGNKFLLSNDGNALLQASVKAMVSAPEVELGSATAKEKILNGETFQTTFNQHVHLAFGVPTTVVTVPSPPTDLSLAVKAAKLMS